MNAASTRSLARTLARWLDRAALAGMAGGIGLMLQPWWTPDGYRWGFFVTLATTVLHIVTSHLPREAR